MSGPHQQRNLFDERLTESRNLEQAGLDVLPGTDDRDLEGNPAARSVETEHRVQDQPLLRIRGEADRLREVSDLRTQGLDVVRVREMRRLNQRDACGHGALSTHPTRSR